MYSAGYITAAVVMGGSSVLAGFTITNTTGAFPEGVLVHSGYSANNVTIRNNTIIGSGDCGVYVAGGSGGLITGNTTSGNSSFAVAFVGGGGAGMIVSFNTITDAFDMDSLGPDLGGGAAGSPRPELVPWTDAFWLRRNRVRGKQPLGSQYAPHPAHGWSLARPL